MHSQNDVLATCGSPPTVGDRMNAWGRTGAYRETSGESSPVLGSAGYRAWVRPWPRGRWRPGPSGPFPIRPKL